MIEIEWKCLNLMHSTSSTSMAAEMPVDIPMFPTLISFSLCFYTTYSIKFLYMSQN